MKTALAPVQSHRAYQRRLQLNPEDVALGDVIGEPIMGQLRHASALRGEPIMELVSLAVAEWLAHPSATPEAAPAPAKRKHSPPPPRSAPTGPARQPRESFTPGVYGIGFARIETAELALFVASALHGQAPLVTRNCLQPPEPQGARDSFCWPHTGDLAELLAICAEVFEEMENGFCWTREVGFSCLVGLGSLRSITAAEFLEHSAEVLLPWLQELSDAAATHLAPITALPFLEALCALEEIAGEWLGLETDFDREGPTRLQVTLARIRWAAHTRNAAA